MKLKSLHDALNSACLACSGRQWSRVRSEWVPSAICARWRDKGQQTLQRATKPARQEQERWRAKSTLLRRMHRHLLFFLPSIYHTSFTALSRRLAHQQASKLDSACSLSSRRRSCFSMRSAAQSQRSHRLSSRATQSLLLLHQHLQQHSSSKQASGSSSRLTLSSLASSTRTRAPPHWRGERRATTRRRARRRKHLA